MYTIIILSDTFGNRIYYDVSNIEFPDNLIKLTQPEEKFPDTYLTVDAISSIHIIVQGLTK